jgi:hypothetical protein
MADAKLSSRWPQDGASARSRAAPSDELELLREETQELRELVIALSRIAIRHAINMKK